MRLATFARYEIRDEMLEAEELKLARRRFGAGFRPLDSHFREFF